MEGSEEANALAAELAKQLTVAWQDPGVDGTTEPRVRFVVMVEVDSEADRLAREDHNGEPDEAVHLALRAGRWWHESLLVQLQVEIVRPGMVPRWLTLGSSSIGGVPAGNVPGASYQNAWRDMLDRWQELAEEAVAEAADTLAVLRCLRVGWTHPEPEWTPPGALDEQQ